MCRVVRSVRPFPKQSSDPESDTTSWIGIQFVIMAPLSKVWPSTPEIDHFRPVGVPDNIDKKTLLGMVESKSE